ncbi:hypothetical protein [Streptomyces sp. NPDC046887]|uniref:hypothetical protein n=1 Tax=Streptomyces sp. NPDC046887 TaxID=3155472 RepID=UPI00340CDFDE
MPRSKQDGPETDVSMRDLLASCAAASAVSTPPRLLRENPEEAAGDGATGAEGCAEAPPRAA